MQQAQAVVSEVVEAYSDKEHWKGSSPLYCMMEPFDVFGQYIADCE